MFGSLTSSQPGSVSGLDVEVGVSPQLTSCSGTDRGSSLHANFVGDKSTTTAEVCSREAVEFVVGARVLEERLFQLTTAGGRVLVEVVRPSESPHNNEKMEHHSCTYRRLNLWVERAHLRWQAVSWTMQR